MGATLKDFRVRVPASPVRQQVVEKLREAISECHFGPGGRLIERELCDLLGVSRSSVREALRLLEGEGLVRLIPNVGPIVETLSVDQAREIYEVRADLEGLAGALFAKRATAVEVKELSDSVALMSKRFKKRDFSGMHKAKTRFYKVLLTGCQNSLIAEQLKVFRVRLTLYREVVLSRDARIADSLAEVKQILKAIKARDSEAARKACTYHINKSMDMALGVEFKVV